MDLCRNVTNSGSFPSENDQHKLFPSSCSTLSSLDDLFPGYNTEGDTNLEWLSIYIEDYLSTTSVNYLPSASSQILEQKSNTIQEPEAASKSLEAVKPQTTTISSTTSSSSILQKEFVVPGKARTKRSKGPTSKNGTRNISPKFRSWSQHLQRPDQDPPLLQQPYWLADSELIFPKNEEKNRNKKQKNEVKSVVIDKEEEVLGRFEGVNGQQQPRRCSHCLSQRTPQWRGGPLGPKTLCNACGVRYKSGRLLPEYRPAKSPTFVSYKHSNSHKKVLEMRTMSMSSFSNGD